MPMKINDSKIANLYKNLEPTKKMGMDQAIKILAEIADKSGTTSAKALSKLPTLSTADQIELVKKGMSKNEKKDLAAILDQGTIQLEPNVKALFEGVLGRTGPVTPPVTPVDGFQVTGDQKNGLTGIGHAGSTVEAINLTASPTGRLHIDDTTPIGKVGADGKFNGKLIGDQAMKDGDIIRMRERKADGTVGDWVTVKANLGGADTRNAEVAVFRVGLVDKGNGKIDVTNINSSRQISEPGAKIQLVNARTKEKFNVTLDDQGTFPANTIVNGKPGDSFSIAASDGKNNTDFKTTVGNVTVPGGAPGTTDLIPDPALHKDELRADGTPMFGKKTFTGPLFSSGVNFEDVQQGQLGDCYFPSAISALAKANPESLQKAIKDNGDGTYTVNFKQKDWATGKFKDVPVKVDGDLYVRSFGGALYGSSKGSKDPASMELWFPLIEKAYAQWKGSYNTIGSGGVSSDVFEAVLGREGDYNSITSSNKDRMFDIIKSKIDAHLPVSAGTYGDDKEALYTNTGVYADHSYSVVGYEESGGTKYVQLRNPWGESEPAGNGANDGIFKLKLDDFAKLYQSLMTVE